MNAYDRDPSLRRATFARFLLLALALGCGSTTEPRTQVMLEIDADMGVRARLETLRVVIDVSDDQGKNWQHDFFTATYDSKQVGDWDKFRWPARLGLVPGAGHLQRRFGVRVEALDAEAQLYVWQSAIAGFSPKRTTVLRMSLAEVCLVDQTSCGDAGCVGSKGCVTCRGGECVAVEIMALPDFNPKASPKDAGSERDAQTEPADASASMDSGVDAGTRTDSGAASGREAGTSDAGARDSGSGAINDSGTTDDSFRVTSIAPSGVVSDLSAALTISFSADVAPASISPTSVAVTRDALAIPGTLDVAKDTVTFTPGAPWALAASYALNLTASVKDASGRALTALENDFTIRDGSWSHEERAEISGGSVPMVAMAKDGYALLAWSDVALDPSMEDRVLASRFTPPSSWSAVETVQARGATGVTAVAVNTQHHAAITWPSISSDVELQTSTGSSWSTSTTVSLTAYDPFLLLGDDDSLVALCDTPTKGSASTVAGLDTTIALMSPTPIDVGGTAAGNSNPEAAQLDGNVLVVFQHTPSTSGSPSQIMRGSLSTAAGVGLSTAGVNAIEPHVAANGPGTSAIVVWTQTDPNYTNIWAARIAVGGNWSAPVRLSDDTSASQKPALTIDDRGRALAVWSQNGAIAASRFLPASGWSTPATISAPGVTSADPAALAMEPGGNAIAAWTQDGPNMALNEVWAARFVTGQGWLPASRVRVSDAEAGTLDSVSLAIDASGRAFAAWYQSNQIWVARFE